MSKHELIPVSDLIDTFQIRGETDDETVLKYAEAFESYHGWGPFPELTVVNITDDAQFPPGLYIADGLHRYRAAKLADVGIVEIACEVFDGDRSVLYAKSLARNSIQGLGMDRETIRNARELIICDLWPTRQYTPAQLAEICQCSDETIRKYIKRLTDAGRVPVVESIVGADGKSYPTKYQKSPSNMLEAEKPPQTSPARPTVPTDGPEYTLCPQCGTPIWPENMGNPDYTYTEQGGRWFCCPDCADEWESSQKSAAATDLTGIPETLPPMPSEALPTRPNPSLEPEHPARPVDPEPEETDPFAPSPEQTEDDENEAIAADLAFRLKNFRPQRINRILLILIDKLNININNIINAPRSKNSDLPDDEKTAFVWILNTGEEWTLKRSDLEKFKELYPGIDVEQELRNSIGWNLTNPKNRKTKTGILKHLNTWLSNSQNRAKVQSKPQSGKRSGYRDAGVHFDPSMYE